MIPLFLKKNSTPLKKTNLMSSNVTMKLREDIFIRIPGRLRTCCDTMLSKFLADKAMYMEIRWDFFQHQAMDPV